MFVEAVACIWPGSIYGVGAATGEYVGGVDGA